MFINWSLPSGFFTLWFVRESSLWALCHSVVITKFMKVGAIKLTKKSCCIYLQFKVFLWQKNMNWHNYLGLWNDIYQVCVSNVTRDSVCKKMYVGKALDYCL